MLTTNVITLMPQNPTQVRRISRIDQRNLHQLFYLSTTFFGFHPYNNKRYFLILFSQIFLTKPRESVERVKPITGTSEERNTIYVSIQIQSLRVHDVSHFLSSSTLAFRALIFFISLSIFLLSIPLLYIIIIL